MEAYLALKHEIQGGLLKHKCDELNQFKAWDNFAYHES